MARSTINPDPSCVQLEGIHPDHDGLTIILRTNRAAVPCPDCSQLSDGIHSWYRRTLADLPWQGVAVRFRLYTRRWFCRNPACSRSIFTERLPDLVDAYARRTSRLAEVVEAVAFALGGEAGHRLLLTLGLTLSPDTLLNIIRTTVLSVGPARRVVGIEDLAGRRQHTHPIGIDQKKIRLQSDELVGRLVLLIAGQINQIIHILAHLQHVGGYHHYLQPVNLPELESLGIRGAGHTS